MLQITSISKTYKSDVVLNGVSLSIAPGESLGLIGESGSGKSTLAKLIVGLESLDKGEIHVDGVALHQLRESKLRKVRKNVQMVFQHPTASLNPKLPIWKSLIEPLENFPEITPLFLKEERKNKKRMAHILLEMVGLPTNLAERYPHQLSGGQLQRVAIARAISIQPKLLICDEPTSSLDVSIQTQILQLLKKLKKELGMSFLFISHDIAAVQYMCDQIAVLQGGKLIDLFPTNELHADTRHSYTKHLIRVASD